VPIDDRDTAGALSERLAHLGADLMIETLDAIADGSTRERPQPLCGVTYAEKLTKAEAMVDWRDAAPDILRRVRAFNPWPIAETKMNGVQLRIWEAELVPDAASQGGANDGEAPPGAVLGTSGDGVAVACGRGILRLLRVQLAGRKPLPAKEFLNAQRVANIRFASS